MRKAWNNANPKSKNPPYFTFIPMRKLVVNYARSSGTHPRIECDRTVQPFSQPLLITFLLSAVKSLWASFPVYIWIRSSTIVSHYLLLYYCWFLSWYTLKPWRWRQYVPSKRQWNSNGLHRVTSQKRALFAVIAVRPANLTCMLKIV
jgi:hypothetical protein